MDEMRYHIFPVRLKLNSDRICSRAGVSSDAATTQQTQAVWTSGLSTGCPPHASGRRSELPGLPLCSTYDSGGEEDAIPTTTGTLRCHCCFLASFCGMCLERL